MGDYLEELLRRRGLTAESLGNPYSPGSIESPDESQNGLNHAIQIAQGLLTPPPPTQTESTVGIGDGTSMLNEAARIGTALAKNEWTAAQDAQKQAALTAAQEAEKERLAQIQARNDWIKNHDAQTATRDLQYRANAPILSTGEIPFAQEQLAAKYMYAMADDPAYQKASGMTADQIREAASNAANRSRAIAQAAGYNLDGGYGSDVSLDSAIDNLASNEARARIDILQGKYSKTTDQFYEQRYSDLLSQGLRPSLARRLAGDDARNFQAEKVAYLSDMLEGYGLNGGYLNELGTRIVGMMGNENSAMGEYYAKMYGTPIDAQQRANTVEDSARSHQYGLENSMFTTYLNNAAEALRYPRELGKIDRTYANAFNNNFRLNNQTHGQQMERDEKQDAREQEKESRKLQAAQAQLERNLKVLDWAFQNNLINKDEYRNGIMSAYGFANIVKSGSKENSGKELREGLKVVLDSKIKLRTSYAKQMETDLNPENRKQYQAQIAALDKEIDELNKEVLNVSGYGNGDDVYGWSDDRAKNIEGIRNIIARGNQLGLSPDAIMKGITTFANGKVPQKELDALIKEALSPQTVSESTATGLKAR